MTPHGDSETPRAWEVSRAGHERFCVVDPDVAAAYADLNGYEVTPLYPRTPTPAEVPAPASSVEREAEHDAMSEAALAVGEFLGEPACGRHYEIAREAVNGYRRARTPEQPSREHRDALRGVGEGGTADSTEVGNATGGSPLHASAPPGEVPITPRNSSREHAGPEDAEGRPLGWVVVIREPIDSGDKEPRVMTFSGLSIFPESTANMLLGECRERAEKCGSGLTYTVEPVGSRVPEEGR